MTDLELGVNLLSLDKVRSFTDGRAFAFSRIGKFVREGFLLGMPPIIKFDKEW